MHMYAFLHECACMLPCVCTSMHDTGQHLLDGITSGSAQMKFNKTSFRKLRVILPSNELLVKFEDLEASLWAKHASNQKESLHLEKLRDTLLPKLLSGEIELTTE